jgi:hypothetical protein
MNRILAPLIVVGWIAYTLVLVACEIVQMVWRAR